MYKISSLMWRCEMSRAQFNFRLSCSSVCAISVYDYKQMNTTSNLSSSLFEGSSVTEVSPKWLTAGVLAVSIGTLLVNIPATALVIYAKRLFPNFRCVHLLSLSFTDTLVATSLIPILWTYVYPDSKISYWGCNGIFLFFAMTHCNSKTQVAVICVDRLLLLIRPDWKYLGNYHRRMLRVNAITLLVICGIMSLPFWMFAKPSLNAIKCKLDNLFLDDIENFCLYTCLVQIFIESVCVAMVIILQRRRRRCRPVQPRQISVSITSEEEGERRKQKQQKEEVMRLETRGIVTIVIIAICYNVCVTPLNWGFLAQGVRLISNTKRTTRHIIMTFSCLNSAVNPFIYCFRVSNVKRAMDILLGKFESPVNN